MALAAMLIRRRVVKEAAKASHLNNQYLTVLAVPTGQYSGSTHCISLLNPHNDTLKV